MQGYVQCGILRSPSLFSAQANTVSTPPKVPIVLGVSYDKGRLLARLDVLKMTGMEGIPASSKSAAMGAMTQTRVDLLVIAADVPAADKIELTQAFRQKQKNGKVIWAESSPPQGDVQPDLLVPPDQPNELSKAMLQLLKPERG